MEPLSNLESILSSKKKAKEKKDNKCALFAMIGIAHKNKIADIQNVRRSKTGKKPTEASVIEEMIEYYPMD
jgi:hypothetical protein